MRKLFGSLMALCFLACLQVAAEPAQKKGSDSLDKKALEFVKQAGQIHKDAKSMHVEVAVDTFVQDGEEKREYHTKAIYDMEKPKLFSLRIKQEKDDESGLNAVCDGKNLIIHSKRYKQYTQAAAPQSLADLGPKLQRLGTLNTGMLFQNTLTADPYDTLMDGVTQCRYAGEEMVGDQKAHHLTFKQADLNWELWIAAEGKPLVVKAASTQAVDESKVTTTEIYSNWKIDEAPDPKVFAFSVPADSKKVTAIKPPRKDND